MMMMITSTASYSPYAFQISHNGLTRLRCPAFSHPYHGKIYHKPTRKLVVAQFKIPAADGPFQIHILKERLWKSVQQDSAKEFPLKKAEDTLVNQTLHVGKKALAWSFIAWFGLAFISDAALSISQNRELFMPLGLFTGCALTEFIKETTLDMFGHSNEKDLKWHLLRIGCFFLLLRLMSLCFPIGGRVLLLHIANGGFMQILWLWRTAAEET